MFIIYNITVILLVSLMKLMKWAILLILLVLLTAGCVDKTEKTEQTPTPIVTETVTPAPVATETETPTSTPTAMSTTMQTPAATPETTPIITPAPEPQTYRVDADSYYGFLRVRHLYTDNPRTDLDIKNLKIRVGDTVIWRNDDDDSYRLDIVSGEGLWNLSTRPDSALMWYGREFHYTFNEPGVYTVAIGNYPKTREQTITVSE